MRPRARRLNRRRRRHSRATPPSWFAVRQSKANKNTRSRTGDREPAIENTRSRTKNSVQNDNFFSLTFVFFFFASSSFLLCLSLCLRRRQTDSSSSSSSLRRKTLSFLSLSDDFQKENDRSIDDYSFFVVRFSFL